MYLNLLQMADEKNPLKNQEKAKSLIENCIIYPDDINLAILPELFLAGHHQDNIRTESKQNKEIIDFFSELAIKKNLYLVLGSISFLENNNIFNSSLILDNQGQIIYRYDKTHLFKNMKEDCYFKKGNSYQLVTIGDFKIAILICYDLRFPEPFRILSQQDVDLIIVVAAWPHFKVDLFSLFARARATENQCFLAAVNKASLDLNQLSYGGHSTIIAPDGRVLEELGFTESYSNHLIDKDEIFKARESISSREDLRKDIYQVKYFK